MKKDNFERKIDDASPIKMNFEDITSKIDYQKYTNRKRFSINKKFMWLVPSLTFCLCLAISLPIFLNNQNESGITDLLKDKYGWDTIYIKGHSTSNTIISVVPHWEEKTFIQKYPRFTLRDTEYNVVSTFAKAIDDNYVEEYSETITLNGYDIYNPYDKKTIKGELFSIKNISTNCAYAVRFSGDDNYYSFINSRYVFPTLGDLKNELNLKSYLSFGKGSYTYFDDSGYHRISFDDCDDDFIWNNLLSDDSLPNASLNDGKVGDPNDTYSSTILSIGVSIPCFGYQNIHIGVNEKGYIQTNIFDFGKTFYIGMDKIYSFMEIYFRNVKGHEIVYIESDTSEDTNDGKIETSEGHEPIIIGKNYL